MTGSHPAGPPLRLLGLPNGQCRSQPVPPASGKSIEYRASVQVAAALLDIQNGPSSCSGTDTQLAWFDGVCRRMGARAHSGGQPVRARPAAELGRRRGCRFHLGPDLARRPVGRCASLTSMVAGPTAGLRSAVTRPVTLVMMAAMPSRVGPSGRSMFDSTVEAARPCSPYVLVGKLFCGRDCSALTPKLVRGLPRSHQPVQAMPARRASP